ncbi:hypothetical protein [Acinetobacter bereziniae]|nr:hypothetical protein [Acinetobacter bereziniae]
MPFRRGARRGDVRRLRVGGHAPAVGVSHRVGAPVYDFLALGFQLGEGRARVFDHALAGKLVDRLAVTEQHLPGERRIFAAAGLGGLAELVDALGQTAFRQHFERRPLAFDDLIYLAAAVEHAHLARTLGHHLDPRRRGRVFPARGLVIRHYVVLLTSEKNTAANGRALSCSLCRTDRPSGALPTSAG